MISNNHKKIGTSLLLVLLIASVLIESTLPSTINNDTINHLDKLVHFLVYGVIAYLTAIVFMIYGIKLTAYKLIGIALFASILGIIAETIQSHTPGRDATIYDVYADLLGACFFLVILKIQTVYNLKSNF
jgi:VanZ family protein